MSYVVDTFGVIWVLGVGLLLQGDCIVLPLYGMGSVPRINLDKVQSHIISQNGPSIVMI